ncbi:MAG: DUF4290 domain-containing protein [Bacteroidales bacterium]|nr:DUF4290 domain-containing protein [Bacteroidales bacterium]
MENKEMDTCKLLYNTERVKLYIPEYGRNVQKMVNYIKAIEDREKRNEQARAVIKVMEIINPQVHLQEDYEHTLWDHLHIISGFSLDVDSPYPLPSMEESREYPRMIPVQKKPLKAVHYGRNIENMIEFVAEKEDGEIKNSMIRALAIYMRQQYLIWNKDTVADEMIYQDIERLSDFRIQIPEEIRQMKLAADGSHSKPVMQKSKVQNRFKNNQKQRKQHNNK